LPRFVTCQRFSLNGTKTEPPAPAEEPEATTTPFRLITAHRNGWFAELADHCHSFDGSTGSTWSPPEGAVPTTAPAGR
jgi:hypothetical protein